MSLPRISDLEKIPKEYTDDLNNLINTIEETINNRQEPILIPLVIDNQKQDLFDNFIDNVTNSISSNTFSQLMCSFQLKTGLHDTISISYGGDTIVNKTNLRLTFISINVDVYKVYILIKIQYAPNLYMTKILLRYKDTRSELSIKLIGNSTLDIFSTSILTQTSNYIFSIVKN